MRTQALTALPVLSYEQGFEGSDKRRPLAITLTDRLLVQHRGAAALALAPEGMGRAWTLRASAPVREIYRVRADGAPMLGDCMPVEGEAPEAVTVAAPGSAVAVLCIDGPLAQREQETWCGYVQGYDGIASRLRECLTDPQVGAVVLRVDSPGGDVAGLEDAVAQMRADVAQAGKPVLCQVDQMAASAAFWLACAVATGGVYLSSAGMVGSVGVLAVHVSEARALEAEGLDVTIIRQPSGKAAGHPAEQLSDVGRARLEQMVASAASRFYAAIGAARGLTPAQVQAQNAAMFEGVLAVQAGLADGVATLPETIACAAQMMRRGSAPSALGPFDARDQQTRRAAEVASPRQAGEARGRRHMDQIALCALLGIAVSANEDQVAERTRALVAFETEAVRLSGEADGPRALGALRAAVERAKRAGEIEAAATRAHVESLLASAQAAKKIVPAQLDDLRAWGMGPGGAQALESYLAKCPATLPEARVEPKVEPENEPKQGADQHGGKTYAQMSGPEKAALANDNPALFKRMRSAHRAGRN